MEKYRGEGQFLGDNDDNVDNVKFCSNFWGGGPTTGRPVNTLRRVSAGGVKTEMGKRKGKRSGRRTGRRRSSGKEYSKTGGPIVNVFTKKKKKRKQQDDED